MESPIQNGVYKASGLGGISYLGAQKALEEVNLYCGMKNRAGASAGALFSTLASCDVKSDDLIDHVMETNFEDLLDHHSDFITDGFNFLTNKGMHRGVNLMKWYGDGLEKFTGKRDMTYGDIHELYNKNNITMISNITKHESQYFSSIETPGVPLVWGARITASIPFFFTPVQIGKEYFVDGGYFAPYPFYLFEDDWQHTLGWEIVNFKHTEDGDGLTNYLQQLIYSPTEYIRKLQNGNDNWKQRTISIDVQGIDVLNFKITNEEKQILINAGYTTTRDWLRTHSL